MEQTSFRRRGWRSIDTTATTWLGLTMAFYTDWPVSFCIALLSALAYFATLPARTAHVHAAG